MHLKIILFLWSCALCFGDSKLEYQRDFYPSKYYRFPSIYGYGAGYGKDYLANLKDYTIGASYKPVYYDYYPYIYPNKNALERYKYGHHYYHPHHYTHGYNHYGDLYGDHYYRPYAYHHGYSHSYGHGHSSSYHHHHGNEYKSPIYAHAYGPKHYGNSYSYGYK